MDTLMDPAPKRYAGRREDVELVHFSVNMDSEAAQILRAYAQPGRRSVGRFLARLIYEERARREERQRVKRLLEPETTTALAGED
jgi:hypothetical protein